LSPVRKMKDTSRGHKLKIKRGGEKSNHFRIRCVRRKKQSCSRRWKKKKKRIEVERDEAAMGVRYHVGGLFAGGNNFMWKLCLGKGITGLPGQGGNGDI